MKYICLLIVNEVVFLPTFTENECVLVPGLDPRSLAGIETDTAMWVRRALAYLRSILQVSACQ